MNVSTELAELDRLLGLMQDGATQLSCAADTTTPGEMRAAFNSFADAAGAIRNYITVIQRVYEVDP